MQQQRRKARVSQEKRASDNDFAMSSTTVPKTEILFAHRILQFLHEKKSTKKKACSNKKSSATVQNSLLSERSYIRIFFYKCISCRMSNIAFLMN